MAEVYLERQRRLHCAVHACNNLLQCRHFTSRDFDHIADTLPAISGWLSPYKSSIPGLGNYDASVVVAALLTADVEVQQFDRRKGASAIPFSEDSLAGLLVNVPSVRTLSSLLRACHLIDCRHWLCCLRTQPCEASDAEPVHEFYWLDSNATEPEMFTVEQLTAVLQLLLDDGAEIYVARRLKRAGNQQLDRKCEEEVEQDQDQAGMEPWENLTTARQRGNADQHSKLDQSPKQEPPQTTLV
eukprot:m.174032 g.174032  ORF g.174032 m.174032 type:complete len:242 (-) comp17883_c0_seq2:9-734(-)